jgi:serine/threonine protein phosphatase PrpC
VKPDYSSRLQISQGNRGLASQDHSRRLAVQEDIDNRPTVPIVIIEDNFQPLPEGALLGNETYYITSIRSEGPDSNVYGVEETRPVFPCPNLDCGYLDNPVGRRTCVSCDSLLNGVMPVHRRHQLREYQDVSHVAMFDHMTRLGLNHPRLLLYPHFAERPYGSEDRYYLVLPDPMPMLASALALPQKIARVLDWGDQLADALAYMHGHKISWQHISPSHIALRDRQAMWVDFNAAQLLNSDKSTATQQKVRDVVGLARVMFYLATGKDTYERTTNLPEAAAKVFERVLGDQTEIDTAEALAEAFREAVVAIRRPTTLRLHIGRHTDVGMIRDLNEDSLLVLELDRVHRSISQPMGLYVVADGMGGHAAGDVASGLAISTMAENMATHLLVPQLSSAMNSNEAFDAQLWLANAVQAANEAVYTQRQSTDTNMGTTLVAALVIGDKAHIANVGDSRAYLITTNDEIRQITTDHSLVERLIATGQIQPEEARAHPQRNVIYRTIGDKEKAQVDFFVQNLNPGDNLLLCSDGLNGKIEDAEISHIINSSQSPQEACERLVQGANDRGGDDNITAIIIQASS